MVDTKSGSTGDFSVPQLTPDQFFKNLSNNLFRPKKTNLGPKKTYKYSGSVNERNPESSIL